jgi:hypothetical protein
MYALVGMFPHPDMRASPNTFQPQYQRLLQRRHQFLPQFQLHLKPLELRVPAPSPCSLPIEASSGKILWRYSLGQSLTPQAAPALYPRSMSKSRGGGNPAPDCAGSDVTPGAAGGSTTSSDDSHSHMQTSAGGLSFRNPRKNGRELPVNARLARAIGHKYVTEESSDSCQRHL